MYGRTFRCLSACAALGVALLAARRSQAEEREPTLLAYRAPESCPTVVDFQRAVQRRSARVRFVARGVHERELSIVVRREGEAAHGELRLVERDGRTSQRNVRFTTCSEAVEGLAIIAVVSLDPQALLEPKKGAPPSSVSADESSATKTTPKQDSGRQDSRPQDSGSLQDSVGQDSSTQVSAQAKPRSKTRVALGGLFNVAPSALPATAFGGSLFLDVASTSLSNFGPMLRVSVSHVERRGLSSDGAEANFTLTLGTVSACPLRLGVSLVEFRPCAFVNGGVLYAWGSQTTNTQQRTRPYGALGGSLALMLQASQTIDIVADLTAGATLVRDSFGFEQDQPWRTPGLYLSSGIGARFGFP